MALEVNRKTTEKAISNFGSKFAFEGAFVTLRAKKRRPGKSLFAGREFAGRDRFGSLLLRRTR